MDGDVVGCGELLAVGRAEVHRIGEAQVAQRQAVGIDRQHAVGRGHALELLVIDQVAGAGGAPVAAVEIGARDRPAAVGHPRPHLEIELVEGHALPAPAGGRAAEHAKPRPAGGEVLEPGVGAHVERLVAVPEIEAAALDQGDPLRAADDPSVEALSTTTTCARG
jgi:hypothetical protein